MKICPFCAAISTVLLLLSSGCAPAGVRVTEQEFPDSWPFTVSTGTLRCAVDGPRRYVTLDTGDGIEYGLNGSAKTFGFPDSRSIQKAGMFGVDVQPFIDRGAALCDD